MTWSYVHEGNQPVDPLNTQPIGQLPGLIVAATRTWMCHHLGGQRGWLKHNWLTINASKTELGKGCPQAMADAHFWCDLLGRQASNWSQLLGHMKQPSWPNDAVSCVSLCLVVRSNILMGKEKQKGTQMNIPIVKNWCTSAFICAWDGPCHGD